MCRILLDSKRLMLLFSVMIFQFTLETQFAKAQVAEKDYVPGEILLKFRQALSPQALSNFLSTNNQEDAKGIRRSRQHILPARGKGRPRVEANAFIKIVKQAWP